MTPRYFEFTADLKPIRPRKAKAKKEPAKHHRLAQVLVLAYQIEELIATGQVDSYSAIAQMLQLTRARVTQITNFLLLAPSIQEQILAVTPGDLSSLTERDVRSVVNISNWNHQETTWSRLRSGSPR